MVTSFLGEIGKPTWVSDDSFDEASSGTCGDDIQQKEVCVVFRLAEELLCVECLFSSIYMILIWEMCWREIIELHSLIYSEVIQTPKLINGFNLSLLDRRWVAA
jgi:hypothetical protein